MMSHVRSFEFLPVAHDSAFPVVTTRQQQLIPFLSHVVTANRLAQRLSANSRQTAR